MIRDVATDAMTRFAASKQVAHLRRVQQGIRTAEAILERRRLARLHAVDAARSEGLSWREIGDALGVTKQAAQQLRRVAP